MKNNIQLTNLIKQNYLFPSNVKAYVQPFSDGSEFFWNKSPSFTQFLNDCDNRFEEFYDCIRLKKKLKKNSIYFEKQQYTQNQEQIVKSNFFQRLRTTYLFSRSYDRLINATDSINTFYLCLIQPTKEILEQFIKIEGKFLFIFQSNTFKLENNNLRYLKKENIHMIFNYQNKKSYDLFDF